MTDKFELLAETMADLLEAGYLSDEAIKRLSEAGFEPDQAAMTLATILYGVVACPERTRMYIMSAGVQYSMKKQFPNLRESMKEDNNDGET